MINLKRADSGEGKFVHLDSDRVSNWLPNTSLRMAAILRC